MSCRINRISRTTETEAVGQPGPREVRDAAARRWSQDSNMTKTSAEPHSSSVATRIQKAISVWQDNSSRRNYKRNEQSYAREQPAITASPEEGIRLRATAPILIFPRDSQGEVAGAPSAYPIATPGMEGGYVAIFDFPSNPKRVNNKLPKCAVLLCNNRCVPAAWELALVD